MEPLHTLLADHQHYHSTIQCRQFITVKAGVTLFGMLRQALRELEARTWNVFEDLLSRETFRCTVDELDEKLETCESEPRARRLALKRARAVMDLTHVERALRDRYREWGEFYGQAVMLRQELGLAPGENLTRERREELEEAMFAGQLASTIRGRILAGEAVIIPPNIAETIHTLPAKYRGRLLAARSDREGFLEFCDQVLPQSTMPPPEMLPDAAQAERLIFSQFEQLGLPAMSGLLIE